MKKKPAIACPTEYEEQCVFVEWLETKGLKFSSIPNSTFTKSWNQKRKNTETGLRAGLPDLLVITPRGLAFVEMKRKRGGVLSPLQKEWIVALNACKCVEARVCKGSDEAISFIYELL
jgi:hypothetical protein